MSTTVHQQDDPDLFDGFAMRSGEIPRWVSHYARFGYSAKAVIYALVGLLSLQVAFGNGGKAEGSEGAIQAIYAQPLGRVLLGFLGVALMGFVVWRFLQAIFDTEDRGTDATGIVQRIGYAISGLSYASLALWAAAIAMGLVSAHGSGDGSKQSLTAMVMSWPMGVWLVGLVGLIVIGVGFAQGYRAYTARFMERYNLQELSSKTRKALKHVGQFGLVARGVTFLLIGGFVVIAAIQTDPDQVKGLGGALQSLVTQPYGPWLLGLVACGLVAYAVYCAMNARYRYFRIR